ncbi:putative uncharacterized protein DDB_G0286901 isoform X1 [Frieseomelitta varia]|uniref:putative uncharacterized protein DDB_G0286901 isoform X1 n=3 Tax=Frieseomelitta varia TaxID=561572 RepID=UPI001CB6A70A|nr:putative uncharacterized protein DDB_G0286901 isoform X1 [Frieseomelitta varia]XP_043507108.1 putative uncharacterized protein DDB_G0286901 isoform X1 [Frieseomelitta varia]XP_043507110.1 putative uncharacterized protein DDB_G0286901 isoform X1 [Frieseomelitta varia]XP_043507111.1 putative uncharacterized protein DDB_G0286901 isoform X1 [Frieseomelitta varia]
MDSGDTDLKKTFDIEQMALIGKMHNMQWLKSNSQLSGHTKTLPDEKETINNTVKSEVNEGTQEESEVVPTDTPSNNSELNKIDSVLNKDTNENDNTVNKNILQSPLEVVDFSQKDMETVWSKDVDVTNTLFPNSQSLITQKVDDQEVINMSVTENIVTVQLEQLRLNEEENNKSDESRNEWGNDQHNISKSNSDIDNQVSSKQCHDNNNNNEKSKSQSSLDTKTNIQKTKRLSDQKIKKQAGNSLKEPWNSKHGSKSKDDLFNLCNDNIVTSTSMDPKRIAVGTTSKLNDKYNKVNSYNKNLMAGKGTRMKEQQFFKQHFSTFNDSGNKSRSIEGLDEKSKSVATKLKPSGSELDKKSNDVVDDIKKCHKVEVTRTQSYNVQYIRNKSLVKSQQRYSRNTTKPEENGCINNPSGFNNSINVSNSIENVSRKKCETQQSSANKQISNMQFSQNAFGKGTKNSNITDCNTNERNSIKSNSISNKRNYPNLSNAKNSNERNIRDDQAYNQKFKKDSNIYRRSSGVLQTYFKDVSGKTKTDDHKRNITDNNIMKDYRVNHINSGDGRMRSQSKSSKITVYSHKTSNGASNTKTDALDSTAINNVQSINPLNSFSSSTKDCTSIYTSSHTPQESQISQASCNGTEVQFVKTEQEDTSNNNSNNKTSTSNSETKSVKFLDNIQEFNVSHHSATSYSDNSTHQSKLPANSFYSDLQNISHPNNAQQIENHQNVENKSYFDNNNSQYNNTTTNNQNTERDLHLMDLVHQKPEQTSHISQQNVLPHHNSNSTITMGNGLPYQNMPAVYLNHYNNTQTVPRKTADSTIIPQNAIIPSTSSYTVENQNMLQTDPSNILMHNTQTSVIPPPGFHNHPITTQPNQWNLPLPDVFLFGNMMNPPHSLNIPMQNSRNMCNTDFNNIQQPNYLQQPLYYVPPMCMQSWNPMIQYPARLFQNPSYNNCTTFPNQVLPTNTLTDSMNCPVPTSVQNNLYKHFQQMQPMENAPSFTVPIKLDNYMGNVQGCKANNVRMKDNAVDVHMRPSQYRPPVPNEYQNCFQDNQLMVPFSYAVTMDPKSGPSNIHMQVNQKYDPCGLATGYQRIPESCPVFHSNQHPNNRKDDVSKNTTECVPPMVSPRECMYYGVNYSRKTDNMQNSTIRSDVKPVTYNMHAQHYVPQFQRNATYHTLPKDLSSRVNMGRGTRKMDQ